MNTKKLTLLLALLFISLAGFAQDAAEKPRAPKNHLSSQAGQSTFGLGVGLPYGAIGIRLGTNLTDGLNLFGGVGYQIAGAGYNIGLLKDFPSAGMAQFYLTGMYGTNAAIKIIGLEDYDKVYTGATFGLGMKMNSRMKEGSYWDVGLLVPARAKAFRDDLNAVKNDPRILQFTSPWPVLIVAGYNFHL